MIIDMHYHLDERMESMDRLLEQMEHHGIDRIALIAPMVEPIHVEGIAEQTARLMRKMLCGSLNRLGLLLYESLVTRDGKFKVLNKLYKIDICPDNEVVRRALTDYPEHFYAWYFINPLTENAHEKMESEMKSGRWIGVKCHPFWHAYPVEKLDGAASFCVENNFPLLIHLGGNKDNGNFRYLPDKYPELKTIYAHAGIPHYSRMWPYVKEKKNVYVDLSSPYLNEQLRAEAVKALGAENCLYGSDGPFGYPAEDDQYDHGAIKSEIERLPISQKEKEMILGANFAALVGL